MATVHPGRFCIAASVLVKLCIGWNPPTDAPAAAAGASTEISVAPLQWTTPCRACQRTDCATAAMASSGTAIRTRSAASASCCGSPKALAPAISPASRAAEAWERLAAPATAQPARARLQASGVASWPAPMKPTRGFGVGAFMIAYAHSGPQGLDLTDQGVRGNPSNGRDRHDDGRPVAVL